MKNIAITAFVILFSPFFTGSRADAQSTPKVIKPSVANPSVSAPSNRPTLDRNPIVNTTNRSKQEPNSANIAPKDPRKQAGSNCPACGMG